MKTIVAGLLLFVVSVLAFADNPNDMIFKKRNPWGTGQEEKVYASPVSDGFLTYSPEIHNVRWTTLGANLGIASGVLSASFTQTPTDWTATTGPAFILNKPTLGTAAARDVAPTGNATGVQVVTGNDTRLTDARTPTAHLHSAVDIGDSTALGRSVLTASSAAAARTAIGAGTSSFDGAYGSLTGRPANVSAFTNDAGYLTTASIGKAYAGTTLKSNVFPIFKSATVSSGVAVFHLTADGTAGGAPLCSEVLTDSAQPVVNDATGSYQMAVAFSGTGNRTATYTVNKYTTANLLSGILGQAAAANGTVVRLTIFCS